MKRFKAYNGDSVIVCLALPENQARLLWAVMKILNPDVELEDREDLHITLAFLGKAADLQEQKNEILQTVLDFSREFNPVSGKINGGGVFANNEDEKPAWAFFESQPLHYFRQGIVNRLMTNLINVDRPYGFIPHITIAYLQNRQPFVLQFPSLPITFDNISVWWAGERYNFPLNQPESTEKDVSSTPTQAYAHGPEGLLSFPGLEEEAKKKAEERLPKGTDERIVKLWQQAYMKKHKKSTDEWLSSMLPDADVSEVNKKVKALEFLHKAQSQLEEKSALFVFKDVNGRYRWLSISSTAFKDKDSEIVSQQALNGAVVKMRARNRYGPLRFWHTKGLDLGECDYSTTYSRSLIESGTFINESVGQAVSKNSRTYKMSIGFSYPSGQPDNEGVYKDIDIFERSIVPADLASNTFTGLFVSKSEVNTMNDAKQAAVISAFKQLGLPEEDAKSLLSQVNFNEKSADNMDVAYKETDLSKLSPHELLEYAQKSVQEFEQEQETHKEIREIVTKAVNEQTKEMRSELKAMMEKMNAMMRRMNGSDDDEDKDDKKTKSADSDDNAVVNEQLNEAQKQINDLAAKLEQATKAVNELKSSAPRRATTSDDNVINTVLKNVQQNGQLVDNKKVDGTTVGVTLKDNHDAFLEFLAGGA